MKAKFGLRITRTSSRRHRRLLVAGMIPWLTAPLAFSASASWIGGSLTDGNWSNGANWFTGTAPGAAVGVTSTDVATFDSVIANTWGNAEANPVVVDSASQNISGINFDLAADNYFIGSTGGNGLLLSSGGVTKIAATLTATNAVETINAPLVIQGAGGTYTFQNNSVNGAVAGAGTLMIGGAVTGAVAGTTALTLTGTNTNANTISGAVTAGSATVISITKSTAGRWDLTNTNNIANLAGDVQGTLNLNGGTYTGTNTLTIGKTVGGVSGALTLANSASLTGAAATNLVVAGVNSNGTLTLQNASSMTVNGNLQLGSSTGTISTARLNVQDTASLTVTGTLGVGNLGTNSRSAENIQVTGGTVSVSGQLIVANNGDGTTGTGTLNITAGTVTADSLAINLNRQKNAPVTATVGGTGILQATNGVTFSRPVTSTGSTSTNAKLTISGTGLLKTKSITGRADVTSGDGLSTYTLALASGTIQALADNASFISGFTSAPALGTSATTGITFNTAGFDIGMAQALAGPGKLNKSGAGTLTLSVANSFSGAVGVLDGILNIRHSDALGATTKTVTVAQTGAGGTPELQLQGGIAITLANLKTSGAGFGSNSGSLRNVSGDNSITITGTATVTSGNGSSWWQSDAGTLTLNSNVTSDYAGRVLTLRGLGNGIINGVISDGTTVNLPINKEGAGTWTLNNGASTYTGATTIKGGTLALGAAGSINGSPVVDVQAGATLDVSAWGISGYSLAAGQTLKGNGTVTGSLVGGTATVAPGAATTGSLAVSAAANLTGSTLAIEIDDSKTVKCDTLAVAGALDVSGATLNLAITGTPAQAVYVIATYGAGMLTGTFSSVTGDSLPGTYVIDYTYNSGTAIAIKQTGDVIPPVWTATWPKVDLATSSGFTVHAKTNENGKAYYVVLASGAPQPSPAQVKAGTDSTNAPALKAASITLTANTEATNPVTGLTPGAAYDVWFVAEDAVPNLQSPAVKVSITDLTTYAEWINSFSVGGLTGLTDDFDHDGKPNFLEFALNSSPASGSSQGKVFVKPATVGGTANVLTLTAAVRAGAVFAADGNSQKAVLAGDQITYVIEAANNLTDWGAPVVTPVTGTDATTIQSGLPTPDSGWIYQTFRTDGSSATDPSDFIRVKVTSP